MEWDYKIQPDSDHVAKFHGDWSRDGGGKLKKEKKEKTSRAFYKSSRTTVTGGLKTYQLIKLYNGDRKEQNIIWSAYHVLNSRAAMHLVVVRLL